MEVFQSVFGNVELTAERKAHIFKFHPEVKKFVKDFSKTLRGPDTVKKSKFDDKTYIFYRQSKQKFLAIVVKTNHRCFILTAYVTNKLRGL